MTFTKYALRHRATRKFMPNSETGKGWSFWNPDSDSVKQGMDNAIFGSVRLFDSNKGADNARVAWARGEAFYRAGGSGGDDGWEELKYKDVGRKKDMLEVVPMTLAEMQPQLAFKPETTYGVVPGQGKLELRNSHVSPSGQVYTTHAEVPDESTSVVELRMPAAHAKLLQALPPGVIELILEVAAAPLFKERSKELLSKQTPQKVGDTAVDTVARSVGAQLESWMTNPPKPAMWHFTPAQLGEFANKVRAVGSSSK